MAMRRLNSNDRDKLFQKAKQVVDTHPDLEKFNQQLATAKRNLLAALAGLSASYDQATLDGLVSAGALTRVRASPGDRGHLYVGLSDKTRENLGIRNCWGSREQSLCVEHEELGDLKIIKELTAKSVARDDRDVQQTAFRFFTLEAEVKEKRDAMREVLHSLIRRVTTVDALYKHWPEGAKEISEASEVCTGELDRLGRAASKILKAAQPKKTTHKKGTKTHA